VADHLLALRGSLDRNIPAKDLDETLLLATWNIRDFDKKNRKGFGKRSKESLFYIAEILSRFDFVAVQEVNRLDEWEEVMNILGPDFDYIATDVTHTSLGGNGERLLYLFDRRKVRHENIAGEIVLPSNMEISTAGSSVTKQFRRSPFVASFQSGWQKFDICTVHIYFGQDYGDKLDQRVQEIESVAEFFGEHANLRIRDGRALILLGDFNVVSPEHKTMQALEAAGFRVPNTLRRKTNILGTKYYDQIAFKTDDHILEYIERDAEDPRDSNAGSYDFFRVIYRRSHHEQYHAQMSEDDVTAAQAEKYDGDLEAFFGDWRTYQISDHKPLWARMRIDHSEDYLDKIVASAAE